MKTLVRQKKGIICSKYNDSNLQRLADRISVNGPRYRGARQPAFRPDMINESEFADELRFKYYECRIVDENTLDFKYVTQAWTDNPDDIHELLDEIYRAFEFNIQELGIIEPISITVEIYSRDGDGPVVTDFTI